MSKFELPALSYNFDALEPYIDAATMEIHHGKHHAAYVANLNKAIEGNGELAGLSIEQILEDKAYRVPEGSRQAVINNGGGHANHSLFWKVLGEGKAASGDLLDAINGTFGSFDNLKGTLIDNGMKRFGSGWTWLAKTSEGKLEAYSTANQDSPIMLGHTPIFGIDVWEHAYYLNYQNRRAEYLDKIFNVVNWDEVNRNFKG